MKQMLINAVHAEQKRMAIVEDGKLVEFNIQMSVKEAITGNVYKGVVQKVERGLQAAFVNYGGKRDGFLPLRDVSSEYFTDQKENGRPSLKVGQEILVQIVREVGERKGALLTTYISLPGRYLVLLPNKQSSGISRKIEDEEDRKRLKKLVEQIRVDEGIGFIVRTAGMSRTKQELSRDYQNLSRLWREIQKRGKSVPAPAAIYQESDFGICSLRDYYTSEINDILVDDLETFKKMREYCKVVVPKTAKILRPYKEKNPIFDQNQLEDQIRIIYQEQVELRSGGYIVINPTEAMITIDVNSGRASNKRNVEETAFKTNLEAAEEIARQLRLRDLGGLIVIDFIDMMDRKHDTEVEKAFKKAMSVDRARIQLSRISKFGILELSRQKKQPTIQEISYTTCPFCNGSGVRPSLEYTALSAFRKIESQVVKGLYSSFNVSLPYEVADYLLNQKRAELIKLETTYDMTIHLTGSPNIPWDMLKMESIGRAAVSDLPEPAHRESRQVNASRGALKPQDVSAGHIEETPVTEPGKKKHRRRSRGRRKKASEKTTDSRQAATGDQSWEEYDESINYRSFHQRTGLSDSPYASVATDAYTGADEGDDSPLRSEADDPAKGATRQVEVLNIFDK
jgi:ribonuclease E